MALESAEHAWLPTELPPHSEFYSYISFDNAVFVRTLELVRDLTEGRQFVDVGCGIGTKLVLAHVMGFAVTGIECREQYAATAHWVCPDAKIENADARGYWPYDAFDVVYMYRPIQSGEGQAALDAWIYERARPGALLVSDGSFAAQGAELLTGAACERGRGYTLNVWRKP
jgi:trans-aconitate methyltransferase